MQSDPQRPYVRRGPRTSALPVQFGKAGACDLAALRAEADRNESAYGTLPGMLAGISVSGVSELQHLREQARFALSQRPVFSVPSSGPILLPCSFPIGPPTSADCHLSTGLLAWYQAWRGLTVSTGQPIEAWFDQSGHGNHAVRTYNGGTASGTANVPYYSTTILGGGPVVRFTNPNEGLDITGLTVLRSSYTFYFLIRSDPGQGNTALILAAESVAGGWLIQGDTPQGTGTTTVDHFFSGNAYTPGPAARCGWQVLAVVADAAAGKNRLYRNGTLIDEQSYTSDGSTDTAWVIGDPGSGIGFVFDAAEILIYDVAHADATVDSRSRCLLSAWSLI